MVFPPSEEELSTTNVDNDDLASNEKIPVIAESAPSADESIDGSWVAVDKPHPTGVPDVTASKESQSK